MTNAELKAWCVDELQWHSWCHGECRLCLAHRAVLRLLAQEEARGEVYAACPWCRDWGISRAESVDDGDYWVCLSAHKFREPVYLQCVPPPEPV